MIFRPLRLLLIALLTLLVALPLAVRSAAPVPPVETDLQAFLDAQPGPLKSYRDPLSMGDDGSPRSAAEVVRAAAA